MKILFSYMIEEPVKKIQPIEFYYIGETMYIELSERKLMKVEVLKESTCTFNNCILSLKVFIIDKVHGIVDEVIIPFQSVCKLPANKYLKKKQDFNIYEWVTLPSESDFDSLAKTLVEYMNLWN